MHNKSHPPCQTTFKIILQEHNNGGKLDLLQ